MTEVLDPLVGHVSRGCPSSYDVLAALPDAVLLVDGEARLVWGNPAATRLFGMGLEQAVGRSGMEFVHPDDLEVALLSMTSVKSKDVGTPLELRLRGHDGWRLVEVIGAPLGDLVLLTARDLTERRRWEVARDEDARFRSLVQNSTSLTMLLDGDGTVRTSSASLTRNLGVDQEWLEGRRFDSLVVEPDRARFAASLATITQRGLDAADPSPGPRSVTVDVALAHADGAAVPFALTIKDLRDDPTIEGLVVTGHDISDRVRTEGELRAANSVLAATLESTMDGILVVGRDHRITSYNRRFSELWGLTGSLMGENADRFVELVEDLVTDVDLFHSQAPRIMADPESEQRDVLVFRDGRVVERASLPQRIDGEVVGRVWSFRDVTENQRLQEELSHQAFHDPLTGLANQTLFRDRIEHAAARLRRTGGRLAVMFVDLDDFKTVNDSLGHSAGDALLVAVSERIRSCIRSGDTAARLGGDEFAVLIDEVVGQDDATGIAERIIDALREPVLVAGRSVAVGASIGITYASGAPSADEVLRNADLAMYTAKAAGKNCFRVFQDEMHQAAVERLDLETRLRGAGQRGELVIHYQPIQALDGGRIAAMEALVRWNHPERGLLGPLSFIPFAEQGGLIEEIGQYVLIEACEEAQRWVAAFGDDAPSVSVNLSPRQLLDPLFPDRVEQLLQRCELPPANLILEITEGALMEDPAAAVVSLERLGRSGVRLAVDDFGTGYSSLAYLQRFPLDLLKIDGSFIDDSLLRSGWSLAEAIVQISHALGLVAIAEGVESVEEAEALAAFGCELAQGYLFARPLPADDARTLISRQLVTSDGSALD